MIKHTLRFIVLFLVLSLLLVSIPMIQLSANEQIAGWNDVLFEDFEGDFPGQWTVSVAPGKTDAYWGKEDYDIFHQADPYDGNYAAYCAKGGSAGVALPGQYPNNMDTRMTCGPFNLSHATDANLVFNCKTHTENNHDILEYSVSLDGSNFYGGTVNESSADSILILDLKNVPSIGNICGQPQVWVSFRFTSDDSPGNGLGIIIDDVLLRQFVLAGLPPQITSISPDTASAGTGSQVTIIGTEFGETVNSVEFWRMSRTRLTANIISWSDTEIVCNVPSGASGSDEISDVLYGVRVFGPGGWSEDFPFNVTFSYTGNKFLRTNPMGPKFVVNDITSDCEGILEAIINAAQTWNNVPNADFYFEYGGTDKPGAFEIIWRDNGPGSTGYCMTMQDSTGEIIAGTIVLNDYYNWSTDDINAYDVQSIVSHEFGHWLVLADLYGEQNRGKMMFGGAQQRTLAPEDIEGIRWIYPGAGTRGQYHVKVTNNSQKDLSVYFKADTNPDLSPVLDVPAGRTVTSWCRVVEAGLHEVNIEWVDPVDGTSHNLLSDLIDVPVEGDTEYSFSIPEEQPVNHPPTLSPIGDKEVTVGQNLTFAVSANDTDDDTLVYSASNLPPGASFDDLVTRTFDWTPSEAGTYTGVHFEVSDGEFIDSEDISITVNPAPLEEYFLTINTEGEGSVSRFPDQTTYTAGDVVQITAIPAAGWQFSSWTGDVTEPDSADTTVIMDADKTITAHFVTATLNKIVFTSWRNGHPDIYIMNPDGSEQTRLTINDINDFTPAVSPDCTMIAFVSDIEDHDNEIYRMNIDGTGLVRLTFSPGWDTEPAWAPDGTRIAFGSDRDGTPKIYVMNLDGSNVTPVISGDGRKPAWSPDGTKMAFIRRSGATDNIFIVDLDTGDITQITNESPGFIYRVSWSPNPRLVYDSIAPPDPTPGADQYYSRGVFIINPDGSGKRMIPRNGALVDAAWPAWSPDGTKVVFATTRHPPIEIYTANIDGTDVVELTFENAEDSFPSWATYPPPDIYVPPTRGASSGSGGGGGGGGSTGVTSLSEYVTSAGKFVVDAAAASADGLVTIRIPKDTIGKDRNGSPLRFISIKKKDALPLPADCEFVGFTYDIGPNDSIFNPAILLTFTYSESDIPPGVAEENLVIVTWQDGKWVECEGCIVDPVKNTITAPIAHFSIYTLIALMSPAKIEITGLTIHPVETQPGVPVDVSVIVANTGDLTDSYTIVLKIKDLAVQDKVITLKGGESQTVSFIVTLDEAGEYNLEVNGLSVKLSVKEPAPEGTVAEVSGPEPSISSPTPAAQDEEKPATPAQPEKVPEISVQTLIDPKSPQATPWWRIVVYIACGAIVVGLGAYFFMRRRRASE